MVAILKSLLEQALDLNQFRIDCDGEQIWILKGDSILTAATDDIAKLATESFPKINITTVLLDPDASLARPGAKTTMVRFNGVYNPYWILVFGHNPDINYSFRHGELRLDDTLRSGFVDFTKEIYLNYSVPSR